MTDIRLRAVEPEDVDFMMECEADAAASRWSDYRAPLSRNQLAAYALTYDADPFRAGQLRLIAENSDGLPVGIVDLYEISQNDGRAFAGLTVHPDFRGKRYGSRSLDALIEFCRDRLGLKQVAAKIAVVNHPAVAVFEKAGFENLCVLPEWHKIGPDFLDFRLLIKKI